jgi:hypothetical protein
VKSYEIKVFSPDGKVHVFGLPQHYMGPFRRSTLYLCCRYYQDLLLVDIYVGVK